MTKNSSKDYIDITKARIFYDRNNKLFRFTGKNKNNSEPLNIMAKENTPLGLTLREMFQEPDNKVNINESDLPNIVNCSLKKAHSLEISDKTKAVFVIDGETIKIPLGIDNDAAVRSFVPFTDTNSNLVIQGVPGSGKSTLLYSVLSLLSHYHPRPTESKPKIVYYDSRNDLAPYELEKVLPQENTTVSSDDLSFLSALRKASASKDNHLIVIENFAALNGFYLGEKDQPQCEARVSKAVRAEILERIINLSQNAKNIAFVFTVQNSFDNEMNGILSTASLFCSMGYSRTHYIKNLNRMLPPMAFKSGRGYIYDALEPALEDVKIFQSINPITR